MKRIRTSSRQLICLLILSGLMALPAFATTKTKTQRPKRVHFDELAGIAAFNDFRGGFEIGNHVEVYNLTGLHRFTVNQGWEPTFNDVFTEVGPEDSDTTVTVGLEEDLSFRQVSEYVQYMLAKGWTQVTVGQRLAFRKDRQPTADYVQSTIRMYSAPGETVVFRIGLDLNEKTEVREVNRILNTFDLIPKPN